MKSISKYGIRYGLITGFAIILYGVIFRLADIHYTSPLTAVFYLLLPAGLITALRAYMKATGDFASLGQTLVGSTILVAIAALLYSLFVFFYNQYVDDSLIQAILQDSRERLITSGQSGAELEEAMKRVRSSMGSPARFAMQIFVQMLIVGLISTGLIAGVQAIWTKIRRRKTAQAT